MEMISLVLDENGFPKGISYSSNPPDPELLLRLVESELRENTNWVGEEALIRQKNRFLVPLYMIDEVLDICYSDILIGETRLEGEQGIG